MKQVLSDLDFNNSSRIRNLPDGVLPQDAVTVAQLLAQGEGLAWKDDARVYVTSNINLASPGASLDGVSMVANDRFVAAGQTDPKENGIYIWNGPSTPATRSLDANSPSELNQAIVPIAEGTNAGTQWRQTTVNPVIGTDNIVWTSFVATTPDASETVKGKIEIATQAETDAGTDDTRAITPLKLANYSGLIKKFSQDIGDGSATSYTVTHNLNTYDVHVEVFRNSGNRDSVIVEVRRASVNAVTIVFATAPASNAFRCVVQG